jgi:hypothetical protein
MKKIYLLSPYTDNIPHVQEERYTQACIAQGLLFQLGYCVYSPIASWHPTVTEMGLEGDWKTFKLQDISIIQNWASEGWILEIPGWDKSKGIYEERRLFHILKKPIRFISIERLVEMKVDNTIEEPKEFLWQESSPTG